ncbi:putative TIM-barrel fold metal-dependent hydrolase [Kineothrix alysoides]|uniref:Putative TIM-barrel fold metal-dependent hydrolase n=1 Tax=Kineothrix alysoides TaxID=1469948 RepID=A0A4R1QXD8_9FIRM|nr:TatD family hydrolase [Kineothrix alysoides]TCL56304.1 putative TIM-barrel fold metal-dependent hydrolase [Kineothrix alysoides]
MLIDIHAHAAGDYSTADSIKNMAEKYDIEKIVLCTSPKNIQNLQKPPSMPLKQKPDSIYMMNRMNRLAYNHFFKDNGDGNQFVRELKNQLPELIIQFLWVDPLDTGYMDNLENHIHTYEPKGIKLHQAWNSFKIDGTEFKKLADIATSYNLPIFIHLYSKREVLKLLRFIKENQNAVFIIGHLTGGNLFRESGINLKNIYFDTSSSNRIQGSDIKEAIDAFGYEHIVFGTDTPYTSFDEQISRIEQLNLSDNVKEHIYSLNARNILALD